MKRVVLVILCLALTAGGTLVGYFMRPPPAAPGAGDASGPAKEPTFEIREEDGFHASPLLSLLGSQYLGRYEHGPAWVHVEYFVDFEENGVKKRAFFQAFNTGGDESQAIPRLPEMITDGYFDLAQSQGAVVVDKDLGLRTACQYEVTSHDPKGGKGGGSWTTPTSWDVFESYAQQAVAEPKRALVLDFSVCEKSRFPTRFFWLLISGSAGGNGSWRFADKGTYAGHDGRAVLAFSIIRMPDKAAATEATAAIEVDKLRRELTAAPGDDKAKWGLGRAIDHQRAFLKDRTPETEYPLAEEAVQFVRQATTQDPGNMFYRAELRKLLFRQAYLTTEGKYAAEFPKVLEEIESLIPLYDAEYTEAAALLVQWKDPAPDKDLPEGEKKRVAQERDAHVVKLLRRHAEIWQKRPDEIKKKLQAYEKDAAGKSYADTPEFKALLGDMRAWAKKDDQAH